MIWLQFLGSWLQPPGLSILFFGLVFYYWLKASEGMAIFWLLVSVVFLYGTSIPIVSDQLISTLESKYKSINIEEAISNKNPKGILVLAANRDLDPSYNLVLNQYVAKIAKTKPLPILFSSYGFEIFNLEKKYTVTSYLSQNLANDFNITNKITNNDNAITLQQSIKLIKDALTKDSLDQVFLITNAWHMASAEKFLSQAGIKLVVVPILTPIDNTAAKYSLVKFIPNLNSFIRSRMFFKEWTDIIISKLVSLF